MSSILDSCHGLPERSFKAGEIILSEGQTSGLLYVLIEGAVGITRAGIEVDTSEMPGAIFGEMSVLLDQPHTATVRTLQPARFHEITEARKFLGNNPVFCLHVGTLLARRLNNLTTYLVNLKAQFADQENSVGRVDEALNSLLHQQGLPER